MRSRSSTRFATRLRAISRRSACLAAIALAIAGCGSGDSKHLTEGQRAGLVAQLQAVRVPAATHDVEGAQTALRRFRASVARLQRAGALDAAAARQFRLGAARLLARIQSDNAAAQPPPVTETTPAPAPQPPGQAKKHDKGPKPGKHHGKHGGEEGGD